MPEYQLPFPHSVSFLPLVIVWYLLAEFGRIIENAAKMGAPVLNSTPFVRQYGKLLTNGVLFYAKRGS